MKLFKYENFELQIEEEIWTMLPFKKLHDRDKTKGKQKVFKEMAFIYHMCDMKSDYLIITKEDEKIKSIKKDIGLPEEWEVDADIHVAMDFYKQRTVTPIMQMYLDSVKSALDTTEYLSNSAELLRERNSNGGVITTVNSITTSLNSITETMKKLKLAEKEVIKEQKEMEGRMKGSQEMGMFEEGNGLYK